MNRGKQDIRDALITKTKADMLVRKSFAVSRSSESEKKDAVVQDQQMGHQQHHQQDES